MTETIATGGGVYPVHVRRPPGLTPAEAYGAVAEHAAALLAVLVELAPADLDRLGSVLSSLGRELTGPGSVFVPPAQVGALLCAVVAAHPDAAGRLAEQLRPEGV